MFGRTLIMMKVCSVQLLLKTWGSVKSFLAVDFYMILFDAILSGKNPAQDYYFLEHEEFKIRDLCAAVGDALLKHKQVASAELVPLTEEEKQVYPMVRTLSFCPRSKMN